MPEAIKSREFDEWRLTAAAAVGIGEVRQLGDGRAAIFDKTIAGDINTSLTFKTEGVYALPKVAGVILLDGGRAYWDYSANNVTYKPVNDRDFYVGTVQGDCGSGDTICLINLNAQQSNIIDFLRDAFDTVLTGTQALGGFGEWKVRGGARKCNITATNEAQKADMLSQFGFARTANAIVELIFNVVSDGAGTVVDVSMGIANATHATDADTIAESCFIHLDANNTNINAESDDGSTEVAATDTTLDYTEGTPVEVWFDLRNEADIQIYVNAALVLGATVFKLDAATGPLKLLLHVEKSASTDAYELDINRFCARLMEQ